MNFKKTRSFCARAVRLIALLALCLWPGVAR